ncbi:LOW QUALITY PROTEIN: glutamate receptor ionotropic, delta-2-like [Panulirus ornatus]|uniref:LOW QUALITY PROTEIN: glutamate receptor ionotropic, delta-2-like n=1 Tax=Panulirus ornatus TaxID=150431 RepID=UPI003A85BC60
MAAQIQASAGHARALAHILRTAFHDARSLLVLYDGSTMARDVIHDLLVAGQAPLAVQVMDMTSPEQHDGGMEDPQMVYHNSDSDVAILLFADAERAKRLLEAESDPWWSEGSLLLVSLHQNPVAREVLVVLGGARRVALLVPTSSRRGHLRYEIVTYFPYSPAGRRFLTQVGVRRPSLSRGQVYPQRYRDFHGHVFHLASWIDDFPYLFYDHGGDVVGMGEAMLQEISGRLNFSYHLQEIPPDGFWGELINGTWVGMLGQVVRREKDFLINGMAVLLDRYHATDFTVPYFSDSYSVTLQVPPAVPRWLSVVYPFGGWVWVSLVGALLLVSLTFHLLLVQGGYTSIYSSRVDVLSTAVWLSRTLLRQAAPRVPAVPGCRPFLVCWWLAGLVLSTSYMGNLIAFLTVPSQARKIASLEELARADVRIHMLDYGNFVPGYLWSSADPVLAQLGNKLSLLPDYDRVLEAFDAGDGVLEATEYSQFLFITRGRSTTSYAVEEKLYPNYVAWAFQKGAPYKHVFDRYLSWMSQSGLVDHWRRSVVDSFRRSTGRGRGVARPREERQYLQPLSLEHLQGAFIVLALVSCVALVVLLLEATSECNTGE